VVPRPRSRSARPGPDNEAGSRDTGIGLRTDDIDGLPRPAQGSGRRRDPEVSRMGEPVPPLFWFSDPEGNTLMVVEIQD
jgi:hypothetical protein